VNLWPRHEHLLKLLWSDSYLLNTSATSPLIGGITREVACIMRLGMSRRLRLPMRRGLERGRELECAGEGACGAPGKTRRVETARARRGVRGVRGGARAARRRARRRALLRARARCHRSAPFGPVSDLHQKPHFVRSLFPTHLLYLGNFGHGFFIDRVGADVAFRRALSAVFSHQQRGGRGNRGAGQASCAEMVIIIVLIISTGSQSLLCKSKLRRDDVA
jgi:hypothetical protein